MDSLPSVLQWLTATPWWVSSLFFVAAIATAVWLTWPDMALARRNEDLTLKLKAADRRVMDFEATQVAVLERISEIESDLERVGIDAKNAFEHADRLYWRKGEDVQEINKSNNEILAEAQTAVSLGLDVQGRLANIDGRLSDLETKNSKGTTKSG